MTRAMTVEKAKGWFRKHVLGRSDVVFDGALYMNRWRVIHTPWFGVRVHKIVRSDGERALHDHPFSFVSLILRGGYVEQTPDGKRRVFKAGDLNFKSADALHRLDLFRKGLVLGFNGPNTIEDAVQEIPAWTIVVRGPVIRRWGFLDVPPGAWEDAKDNRSNQEARQWRASNGQGGPSLFDERVPRV